MIVQSAASRSLFARPAWRRAVSMGALLAGLGAMQFYPAFGAPFAALTAQLTAAMLSAVGLPVARAGVTLVHAGGFAAEIDLACTALVPAVLLATAMAALRLRPMAVALGMMLAILVNQARLVSLVWLGVHAPGYLDPAHQLLWPVLLVLTGAGYLSVWRRVAQR